MDFKWYTILLCLSIYSCPRICTIYAENSYADTDYIPKAASRNQRPSPIDIQLDRIEEVDMPPLQNPFANLDTVNDPVVCHNDGKTVSCTIMGTSLTVSGGPLKDEYVFITMHFHWGKSELNGSEHLLDGQRFASELHAIFYNKKYSNLKAALQMEDGLCILGWLGIASDTDSQTMDELFKMVEKLINYDAKLIGRTKDTLAFLKDLAEPINGKPNWVTYQGALTVEPFSDSATWIIFGKPYAISDARLNVLRQLQRADGTPNVEHSEEIAPLGSRLIYKPTGGKFETDESSLVKNKLA